MELTRPAFTVVVADDDEDGALTRDLAQHWHAEGLLDEFAWVTPADVSDPGYGPATVLATVVGREEQVELMTLLGARPTSLLRIVLLHVLTHERSSGARLVAACDRIADLVSRAMPRQIENDSTHPGMQLLRVNLMVPESDVLAQDAELVEPRWEVNAVVSPEDRPDLDRVNVFVRRSVNLHGHALAAAAAVGGLWVGAPVGAFDSDKRDSTSGGGEVVVIRCQARMVVGDDRSQQLSARVVEKVRTSPLGAASLVGWGVPADDPASIVGGALEKLALDPQWAPLERTRSPLEKTQVSLGTLLRSWALFQLQLPLSVLALVTGLGRSVVEKAITAATVGRGAGEVGRVRPLTPEQARQVAEVRLRSLSDELRPARLDEEAASWGQTTPRAWRELRELAIGLVDGSRLPDRFTRRVRAGLDELVPPHAVVPPADDTLTVGDTVLGPVDAAGAARATRELADRDVEEPASPSSEPSKKASDAQEEEPRNEELDALLAWVDRRRQSLFWQLAGRVDDLRLRERSRADSAKADLDPAVPDTRRLRSARTVVSVAYVIAGLTLSLQLLWFLLDARVGILPDFDLAAVARYVGIVLVVLLGAGTFSFQSLRGYEWQVQKRMHVIRQAGDEYVEAGQQEKRWSLMYQGVQDWASIVGELLHRPWTVPETPEHDLGSYEGLPAAVGVAVPVDTEAGPGSRVVTRAVEQVCQRGWLAEEFQRLVSASPSNDPAAQPHAGDLPADLDLGLRPEGPRRELVEVAGREDSKAAATACLADELTALVRSGDVRMPSRSVRRLGPYSGGDVVADRDFFGASTRIQLPLANELFQDAALIDRLHLPERTVLCLPLGVRGPDLPATEVHHCGVSVATRVDVSPLVRPADLVMFAETQRPQHRPVTGGDFN